MPARRRRGRLRAAADGRPRLVGYVVPADGALDTEQLRRDRAGDGAHWTAELAGRPAPAPLPIHDVGAGQPAARALGMVLPAEERAALDARARAFRLSPASLVHAALVACSGRVAASGIPLLDRNAYMAGIDAGGRLIVPDALRDRSRTSQGSSPSRRAANERS